jgi:hypothetical protein
VWTLNPDGKPHTTPLSLPLDGSDATVTVLAARDCDGGACAKWFVAESGSLTVDVTASAPGDAVRMTWNQVTLREATWDAANERYVAMAEGQDWCLDGTAVDETLPYPLYGCAAAGTGIYHGDRIGDFDMVRCSDATVVPLHSGCGGDKVVWIQLNAAWCGPCVSQTSALAVPQLAAYGADRIELRVLFGDDQGGGAMDFTKCREFASQAGLDPANVYIDTVESTGYPGFLEHVDVLADGDGTYQIPFNILMRSYDMKRRFPGDTSATAPANNDAVINALGAMLGPPP